MDATTVTPWNGFEVTGPNGDQIPLHQAGPNLFHLGEVTITYTGKTGLEKYVERGDLDADLHEQIRTIDQALLPSTDLASVPGPLRWFTNTYGPHTPAALIHDYLIPDEGDEPIIPEEYADRYFRHMLGAVGVPRFKSFIMWAAVALRTRGKSQVTRRRLSLGLYGIAALVGLVVLLVSLADIFFGNGSVAGIDSSTTLIASLFAPVAASSLWGRQYGAGIVASLAAPWLIPATVAAVLGYSVYWVLERTGEFIEQTLAARSLGIGT